MAPETPAPSAVFVPCPDCGEETLHSVLKGRVGESGGYTLEATVKCTDCSRVHHAVVREAADRDVPVVVSEQAQSWRSLLTLPGDEELAVEDVVTVDERPVEITALEKPDGRRVEQARVDEVATVWGRVYDELVVHFTINMGKKTISKSQPASPEDVFTVGDELTFGRLRVTVHGIKTEGRMLRRGSAEVKEIKRVFARPTPPERKPYRPPKPIREAQARVRREAELDHAEEPDHPGVRGRTPGGGRGGPRARGAGGRGRRSRGHDEDEESG